MNEISKKLRKAQLKAKDVPRLKKTIKAPLPKRVKVQDYGPDMVVWRSSDLY